MADVVLSLPHEMRGELKDPMGAIYTDAADLIAEAGDPIVAVGDVVTYHLLEADRRPDVALVDGKTKREAVAEAVWDAIEGFDHRVEVANPQATLSADLLTELRAAIDRAADGETTVLVVEGEEDLAALPVLVAAPDGASLVYGQPDEGMVLATVTPEVREGALDLLERMDGDPARMRESLGLD
ncbi:GTP-dependent dephospho-CoA kinase family protein [Salinirubellus salinus]|uniref:GTP-dependent dephospho-CoA kinase n=1 Tax=Salinirubellus salinus TaxID=1364945 RepID=A0A9E7R7W4_9EURY|nr:GTP-dependent dephospho-CoA kinase family protein [Salinirubellus salinus]UWM56863.1 GTP-dependent dephospho-CoA kinase family protein [Salinirubellus salinus]